MKIYLSTLYILFLSFSVQAQYGFKKGQIITNLSINGKKDFEKLTTSVCNFCEFYYEYHYIDKDNYYLNANPTISLVVKDNWLVGITLGYGYGEGKWKTKTDSAYNNSTKIDYSRAKATSRGYKIGIQSQYLKPIFNNLYWTITPATFYQTTETITDETYLGRYAQYYGSRKYRSYEENISVSVGTGMTYFIAPRWAISSDFFRYTYSYTDFLTYADDLNFYSKQKGIKKEHKLSNFTQNLNFSLAYRF